MLQSFRPLARFWAAVLLVSGVGAAALQALGPVPSGAPIAARDAPAPAPEAATALSPAAQAAASAAAATTPDTAEVAPVMAPALAGAAAALAGSSPVPPGPRKAAPPKTASSQRAAPAGEGVGPRYGADRRAPTRDIWGNPLQPPDPVGGDRPLPGGPLPGGRGEAGYIGVYRPAPDGARGYGGADRRAPGRDIWGRPLAPPNAAWGDRPSPGGRGEGEFMGIYAPTPDGSRVLIRPGP